MSWRLGEIEPLTVDWHRDDSNTEPLQDVSKCGVARVLDQHACAARERQLRDKLDRICRSTCDDDARRLAGNATPLEQMSSNGCSEIRPTKRIGRQEQGSWWRAPRALQEARPFVGWE